MELKQVVKFSNSKDDSITHYVNKYGQQVAKSEVLELTVRNTQKLREDDRLSFVKYFDGVNKRMNNLEQATKTIAEYNKVIDVPIVQSLDSSGKPTKFRTFLYKDSLNSVNGLIKPDTVTIKLHAVVPIYSVMYWQRNKFLGLVRMWPAKRNWFNDVMSTNPSVTIKSYSNIQIKKRK